MIGRLSGTLLEKNPPSLLIDVGGVGYEVEVPMSTYYELPATGQTVQLLTHFVVREDAQLLFGFASQTERAAFRALLKVNGVGAKVALSILSGLSTGVFEKLSDAKRLSNHERHVLASGGWHRDYADTEPM